MIPEGLMEYITDIINGQSNRYKAEIPARRKPYRRVSSNLSYSFPKRTLNIERRKNPFTLHLPSKAEIFEPDIEAYARKTARRDHDFRERLNTLSIDPDDIEQMIKTLTYGKIVLHLRGRTYYEEDYDEY